MYIVCLKIGIHKFCKVAFNAGNIDSRKLPSVRKEDEGDYNDSIGVQFICEAKFVVRDRLGFVEVLHRTM